MAKAKISSEHVEQFLNAINEATGCNFSPFDFSQVERKTWHAPPDLVATSSTDSGEAVVIVEFKKTAYPRDIKEAAWNLDEIKESFDNFSVVIPMVIAERLSPGAKEMLRSRNIGYFDASESMFLKAKHWLVNIDRQDKPSAKRQATSLFTGSREQVIHALLWRSLINKSEWITGSEIADLAGTSHYTVSLTLQELERMEWIESEGKGKKDKRRRLIEPGKLLDSWAESWRLRKEARTRWFVYAPKPNLLLKQIAEKIDANRPDEWAFTGEAAANVISPLLTSTDTAEVVVAKGQVAQFAENAGLQRVEKGANVTIVERSRASLMLQDIQHEPYRFVSPIIMYLDLMDGRGRRKELAAHLRSTILKI